MTVDRADLADAADEPADETAERDLVERARTDRHAFAELYRLHVSAVHAVAFRRSNSAEVADEATSATFERAPRSIDRFEWRSGGVRPWLFRIASNEVAEIYRRRGRPGSRRGQLGLRALAADERPDAWAGNSTGGRRAVGDVGDDYADLRRSCSCGRHRRRHDLTVGLVVACGPSGHGRPDGATDRERRDSIDPNLRPRRSRRPTPP